MAEALANENDLLNDRWTISSLRDYFITLIHSNEMKASGQVDAIQRQIDLLIDRSKLLNEERDLRYEQRFQASQRALDSTAQSTNELFLFREKAVRDSIDALRTREMALEKQLDGNYEQLSKNIDSAVSAAEVIALARESGIKALLESQLDKTRAIRVEVQNNHDNRFNTVDKQLTMMATVIMLDDRDRRMHESIVNVREALSAALDSSERAILKAELATEKRFDAVNEFRATLADQQRLLIPRLEVEVIIHGVSDKMEAQAALIKAQDERIVAIAAGKTGIREGWGWAVGIIGLVMTMLAISGMYNRNTAVPAPTSIVQTQPAVVAAPAPAPAAALAK